MSGRSVADLERVSRFGDEVLLVGSHGIELRLDDPDDVLALDEQEQESMARLEQVLEQVADSLDQVWLEPKPAGYALHTRLATDRRSRVAHLVARSEAQAEIDDLKVRLGKNVIEFSVRSTTKGEAVEHLRRYTKATAVLYAGDDVTDEDAFVALGPGDLGLKSGSGPTAADHRVDGPGRGGGGARPPGRPPRIPLVTSHPSELPLVVTSWREKSPQVATRVGPGPGVATRGDFPAREVATSGNPSLGRRRNCG